MTVGRHTVLAAAIAATTVTALAVGGTAVAGASTRSGFSDSFEAEEAIVSNFAQRVPCGACSGGMRVSGLGGPDNGTIMSYVDIPENGYYTVTVYYTSDRPRDLSVNDKRLRHLDSGGVDKVAKRSIRLYLKEKFRVARVELGYDTGTPGADVDRVVVSRT